MAIVVNTEV